MKRFLFYTALSVLSFNAAAYDGNDLYDWSKANDRVANGRSAGEDSIMAGMYMGYVIGSSDYMNGTGKICYPKRAKNQQVLDIVSKYLADHPENRTENALVIIHDSVQSAFPCQS